MKSKDLIKLSALGAASMILAACGGGTPSSAPTSTASQEQSVEPSTPSESSEEAKGYSATVLMPDGSPASGVKVQWCDSKNCYMPIEVDETGTAYNEDLDSGNYIVHLMNVPSGYTYNPNIYEEDQDNKHVNIQLLALGSAKLEDKLDVNGPYNRYMWEEGKPYEVTVDGTGKFNYLGFNAKEPGVYEIESWAVDRLSTNPTDPVFAYFGGERSYIPSAPVEEKDGGGIGANFKYTWNMGEDSFRHDGAGNAEKNPDGSYVTGVSHTFGILATASKYPTTFAVMITRVGDYVDPVIDVEMVDAKSTLVRPDNPAAGTIFDRGRLLEGEEVAYYDEANDVYRLGDAEGQIIYAKISKACEFFDNPITMFAAGGSNPFKFDNGTTDYSPLVATYAKYCNNDGVYPMNAELHDFMDKLQANNGFFYGDGGWISSQVPGYKKGCEWLFAAGYYVKAEGTESRPFVLNEEGISTCKVEEGQSVFFKLKLDGYVEAEITCNNANACFVASDGTVTENEDHSGFSLRFELEAGYNYFSVKFSDGGAGNIGFNVVGYTIYDLQPESSSPAE